MSDIRCRRSQSTTFDQYRDAIKDLDTSVSGCDVPKGEPLAHLFMRCWDANDTAAAISYLKLMETKAKLQALRQAHGCWRPPPEVANYLKKRPKPMNFTKQLNNEEMRNLKLVLHILGVSRHENKPFKQFLKAKTIRQKRLWLYKHLGPIRESNVKHLEPICQTRLKRLFYLFPDRFKDEDGIIYFNNKVVLYDEESNFFYFGTRLQHEQLDDDSDSSDFIDIRPWRSD